MRKFLTLAIPILLGVGLLTAALNGPRDKNASSPRRQAGVATETALPAVIEESPVTTATAAPTTSSTEAPAPTPTTAPAAPKPTTTSTAARPMTTVPPAPPTPVTPAKPKAPAATTTTLSPPEPQPTESAAPSTVDCGEGTASARAIYGSNQEATSLYAEVVNESNREIELDRLAVKATYPDGTTKTYTLDVAGRRLQPGEKAVFSIPDSTPQGAPKDFVIGEFGFHTAGMPECASR